MRNLRVVIIIVIIAVIFLFIGSAVRSWYLFLKEPVARVTDAIPQETSIIIRTSSVFTLFESVGNTALIDLLDNDNSAYRIISNTLDSIDVKDTKLSSLLSQKETVFAFSKGNKGNEQLLVAVAVGKTSPSTISGHIGELVASEGLEIKEVQDFYSISGSKPKAWYYIKKGVFVIASDSLLLVESFNTLQSGNGLTNNPGFSKLLSSTGKSALASVIINNQLFARSIWPAKASLLNEGTPFNGWSSFDITIKKSELTLTGFTFSPSAHLFSGQLPVEFDGLKMMPSNTALMLSLSLSDQELYISQFNKKDTLHVKGYDLSIRQETIEIFRPQEHIKSWIGNTVSIIYTTEYFKGNNTAQIVIIGNRDKDSALYYLNRYIEPVNDTIGRLHFHDLAPTLWGSLFGMKGELWYMITSNFVAIAPSRRMLEEMSVNNTRIKGMNELKDVVGQTSNLFVYMSPRIIADWLKANSKASNKQFVRFIGMNRSIGFQYSADNDLQYTHAWMMLSPANRVAQASDNKEQLQKRDTVRKTEISDRSENEKEIPETTKINEIKIKSGISFMQVMSGETKHSKWVAVVSNKDVLKMYDHKGKELWRFDAPEPIKGKLFEVDVQKNGKLEILVVGSKHLYILNQKGQEISGSPVKLPERTAGGATLLDYDNKKDYRLIYVGNDDKMYNITLKGKELPDWQKPVVSGPGEITFHRIEGRDYLVYKNNDRMIKIYDRRGRERIKTTRDLKISANTTLYGNKTNNKGPFLTVTSSGELTYLSKEGQISKSSFGSFGQNPWFTYTDFNSDGSMDFIFSGGNKISAYTKMKDVIAEKVITKGTFGIPYIYTSSGSDKWIFARNKLNNEIIGFSNNGKVYPAKIISETDPIIFNPGGRYNEIMLTSIDGKLVFTELSDL